LFQIITKNLTKNLITIFTFVIVFYFFGKFVIEISPKYQRLSIPIIEAKDFKNFVPLYSTLEMFKINLYSADNYKKFKEETSLSFDELFLNKDTLIAFQKALVITEKSIDINFESQNLLKIYSPLFVQNLIKYIEFTMDTTNKIFWVFLDRFEAKIKTERNDSASRGKGEFGDSVLVDILKLRSVSPSVIQVIGVPNVNSISPLPSSIIIKFLFSLTGLLLSLLFIRIKFE